MGVLSKMSCCYLLTLCEKQQRKKKTYVGYTVNPLHHLRQHNGALVCNAEYTKRFRPWQFVYIVMCFPTKKIAQKFESAWQHSRLSKWVKRFWKGSEKTPGIGSPFSARRKLVEDHVLVRVSDAPWSNMPLAVVYQSKMSWEWGQELQKFGFYKTPSHISFKRVLMDIIQAMFRRPKRPKIEKMDRESIVRAILRNCGLAISAASRGSRERSSTTSLSERTGLVAKQMQLEQENSVLRMAVNRKSSEISALKKAAADREAVIESLTRELNDLRAALQSASERKGGKRCSVDKCNSAAQKFRLCWKHGGYS